MHTIKIKQNKTQKNLHQQQQKQTKKRNKNQYMKQNTTLSSI